MGEQYRFPLPSGAVLVPFEEPGFDVGSGRLDGRKSSALRPMMLNSSSIIPKASGSAYIEQGNQKVVVTVYGPRPSSQAEFAQVAVLQCDIKFATFSSRSSLVDYAPVDEERELSQQLHTALAGSICLTKYPKSVIDVYALVLQSDGAVLPSSIVGASMALADAGIEMFDIVSACSASIINDSVLVDPTEQEQRKAQAGLTLAYSPALNEVTLLLQSGKCREEALLNAVELCIDGCGKTHSIMKESLLNAVSARKPKPLT